MNELPERLCHHPELWPTDWNQAKPRPTLMIYHCKCGRNFSCPVCGWGQASYPCDCNREKSKSKQNIVWPC